MTDWLITLTESVMIVLTIGIVNAILYRRLLSKSRAAIEAREAALLDRMKRDGATQILMSYPESVWKSAAGLFIPTGYILFCIAVLILYVSMEGMSESTSAGTVLTAFSLVALFSMTLPWVHFIGITRTAHEVNDRGIRKGSPWGRAFFATWNEVESVKFEFWNNTLVVRTTKGTIRIGIAMVGVAFFKDMLLKHRPEVHASLSSAAAGDDNLNLR